MSGSFMPPSLRRDRKIEEGQFCVGLIRDSQPTSSPGKIKSQL